MNCYFCQKELEIKSLNRFKGIDGVTKDHPSYKSCDDCAKPNGLTDVICSFEEDGSNLFTHMILDKSIRIPATGPYPFGGGFGFYYAWNIRLNHKENTTVIYTSTDSDIKELLKFKGFPMNPQNALRKLKLYLLFS